MSVNLAVLGFAHGHVQAYLARWKENPDWGVRAVAGWDHDTDRLKQQAEAHGIEAYTDLDALLASDDINAVVVSAETFYHARLVEAAAAAGKAIVVQKPMALTVEEADRIVAAVDKAGVPFTMAWQMRTDPQNLQLKELMESGTLGRILMVRRRHCLSTHTWANFDQMWHADPVLNRDMWADDASHPIDFIHWLLGMPETVTAELMDLVNPKVPRDNGIAIFRYKDGPLAEVSCSFTCVAGENTTEVVGEKGVAIQNYGDGPSCGVPRPKDAPGLKWFLHGESDWHTSEIPSPPGHGERIAGLARPLADFLNGRRGPIADARDARDSLRLVLACYPSSDEGRRVTL
jgi:predicted dehydrogenase